VNCGRKATLVGDGVTVTNGSRVGGRSVVLRSLRHFKRALTQRRPRISRHREKRTIGTVDDLRQSSPDFKKGREKAMPVTESNVGTVSKAVALGKLETEAGWSAYGLSRAIRRRL